MTAVPEKGMANPDGVIFFLERNTRKKHNTISHQDRSKQVRKPGRSIRTIPRTGYQMRGGFKRRIPVSVRRGYSKNPYSDITPYPI